MDRVFLDANVLFSAAWAPGAGLRRLWHLADTMLLASAHVAEEARRNLATLRPGQLPALAQLLARCESVPEASPDMVLPSGVTLAPHDQPVLLAAIAAHATHLLTGDLRDFGHLLGRTVAGVRVLRPAGYLRARAPGA